MNWKELHNDVRLLAADVPVGQTRGGMLCPACSGGRTKERTLSITVEPGRVLFVCHRASCGAKGVVGGASTAIRQEPERSHEPYYGSSFPLELVDYEYFIARFDVRPPPGSIRLTEHSEYLFDLRNFAGDSCGWMVRQPWWLGQPEPPRKGREDRPKSRVFMDKAGATPCAWYHGNGSQAIVIVEDALSAMKAAQRCPVDSVALLGTGLTQGVVWQIQQRWRGGEIILALDADATGIALAHARKWWAALPNLRVVILQQDIKDMPASDIADALALAYARR